MKKTKIEWCDYTWNPVVGCKRECSFCYARKIFQRFHKVDKFIDIRLYPERLGQPLRIKAPSKIFVGSMSDIEWWSLTQMNSVLDIIKQCPQHIFLFLTKNGEVYYNYTFPDNCWFGITSINERYMFKVKKINVFNLKFLCIEPLLMRWSGYWLNSFIDWIIIGGLTPKPVHKTEWIDNILKEADRLKTPVFIKHNAHYPKIRQEFPL